VRPHCSCWPGLSLVVVGGLEGADVEVAVFFGVVLVVVGDVLIDVEEVGEEGRPAPHAVAGLAEVVGAGVGIDRGGDFAEFLVAWEGMEDGGAAFHSRNEFGGEFVFGEIDLLELFFILGAVVFALDAGHVEAVECFDEGDAIDHVVERAEFPDADLAFEEHAAEFVRHRELAIRRADEVHRDVFVQAEEMREGADGAAAAEVAAEAEDFAIDAGLDAGVVEAEFVEPGPLAGFVVLLEREGAGDGVDVEQCLGGVFVGTGTGIDDGDAPAARLLEIVHHVGAAFGELGHDAAHDDDIEIAAEHADRIEGGFSLGFGGGRCVADFAGADSEDLAGGFEGEEGSGGGLGEVEHRPFVSQEIAEEAAPFAGFGEHADAVGGASESFERSPRELIRENDVIEPFP